MRFSSRRRSASSMSHGKLVAASTITFFSSSPVSSPPPLHPSICTRNSDLTRRDASCSPAAPRDVHSESISSMKMVDGAWCLARSKRMRTIRSDSPRYLLASVLDEMLKNVVPHSVATALASIVLPVPGGPNISTPFHGRRIPRKYSGIHSGKTTASSSTRFASVRPAISSQRTDGDESKMSRCNASASSPSGPRWPASRGLFSASLAPLLGFTCPVVLRGAAPPAPVPPPGPAPLDTRRPWPCPQEAPRGPAAR